MMRIAIAAMVLVLTGIVTSAAAQEACPRNAASLAVGTSLSCRCEADQTSSGAVFGSARYSSDSVICRAARHAGAIPATGGIVTVHAADGCSKLVGSASNGVTSTNWGSAVSKTFAFAKPAPECGLANVASARKPAEPAKPEAAPAPKPTGSPTDACPATVASLEIGTSQICGCAADKIRGLAGVYGTARYSQDSSICRAAAHAGAVPATGGPIQFYVAEGCPKSVGSDSNSVKSSSWAAAVPKTVAFAYPTPACGLASIAEAPKPTVVASAAPTAAPAPAASPATPSEPACPRNLEAASGMTTGKSLKCLCPADAVRVGSVFGIDRYSSDSGICRSAKHAGKVGDAGGVVTIYAADGCGKFEGSDRNGVKSAAWPYPRKATFAFAMPAPTCEPLPAPGAAPVAKPAEPPAGSPLAGWQARARTYAATLPEPLAGWTATTAAIEASDSAMAGRIVGTYRHYRLGQHTANLDSVMIAINNNPDGSARYPIELWNDEAKRSSQGWSKKTVAGRDALEGKSGAITELYFLMANNLFVKLSWQEAHLPRAKMEEYLKVIDFAKIEKLPSK